MIKPKERKQLKDAIDFCKKPLVIFDGDPDGTSSFIQFYQYKSEGKGIIIKTTPHITKFFVRKIEEYSPDAVFISAVLRTHWRGICESAPCTISIS